MGPGIPGGTPKPWGPAVLSPLLWTKAGADCEEATGDPAEDTDPVVRWLNRGSAGTLLQEATTPPAFDATNPTLGGKAAVLFDDATALQKLTSNASPGAFKCLHDGTGCLLVVTFTLSGNGVIISTNNTAATDVGLTLDAVGNELRCRLSNGGGTYVVNNTTSSTALPGSTALVLSYELDTTDGYIARVNGTQIAAIPAASFVGSPSSSNEGAPLTVGNRNAGSIIIGASVHEIALYAGKKSVGVQRQAENYAMAEVA